MKQNLAQNVQQVPNAQEQLSGPESWRINQGIIFEWVLINREELVKKQWLQNG